jgi:ligand-binding SRPBCC domain-containing protein
MIPDGVAACFLEDSILYALPFGALGRWVGGPLVRARLEKMFSYRHRVTREAFSSTEARPALPAVPEMEAV